MQDDQYGYELTGRDGIYMVDWPNLHITIYVDRMRESHNYDVHGEVTIHSSRPSSAGHIRQGRILLTSPTSRRSMAKQCEERDKECDWDTILEQLCVSVLKNWREGEPETQLTGNADVAASTRWLIHPVIQVNKPTLLWGPGGNGKSYFAQYLAVLADAGVSATGLNVEPCQGKVLYVDWETDQPEIDGRITMIRRGLGLEGDSGVWYKPMTGGLRENIEVIRRIIIKRDIEFMVVDSVGLASGGDSESAEVILGLFGAVRGLRVSSLLVDHTNKQKQLFGSEYKVHSSRVIYEIKKHQEPGQSKLVFGLFHRKGNNSQAMPDMGYELNFTDLEGGAVGIERKDVRDTNLEVHLRVVDRISALLRRGPMTVTSLSDELEKSEQHIRKELSAGVRQGKFIRLEDGTMRYGNRAFREEEGVWKL